MIGISNLGLGIGRRTGGGFTSSYWANTGLFYELWDLTKNTTGLVRGDTLGTSGSGLNTVYETPDTDGYRTVDTDNCWWKTDASRSITDGNRLIGYDFARTIVKYLDVSPYTIHWVGILNVGASVTNQMRDSFHLSIWWDNISSDHGMEKGNRIGEQSNY
jgi:hypothetical protein